VVGVKPNFSPVFQEEVVKDLGEKEIVRDTPAGICSISKVGVRDSCPEISTSRTRPRSGKEEVNGA
jgi:hypothetical protein